MLQKLLILIVLAGMGLSGYAQEAYMDAEAEDLEKTYVGGKPYKVKLYTQKFKAEKPKNIIFLIGDGMGVSHVFSGLVGNRGKLFIENRLQAVVINVFNAIFFSGRVEIHRI